MPTQLSRNTNTDFERRSQLIREAFDEFHVPLLYFVMGLTQNKNTAEDILQELWKWVIAHLPEEKIKYKGLLYMKARNLTTDHFRRNKRTPEANAEMLEEWHMPKQSRDAYTSEEEQSMKVSFFERFDGVLTDRQADVFWAHARYGMIYQEIADVFQISVSTVGSDIAIAREKLAEKINKGAYHDR